MPSKNKTAHHIFVYDTNPAELGEQEIIRGFQILIHLTQKQFFECGRNPS